MGRNSKLFSEEEMLRQESLYHEDSTLNETFDPKSLKADIEQGMQGMENSQNTQVETKCEAGNILEDSQEDFEGDEVDDLEEGDEYTDEEGEEYTDEDLEEGEF